MCSVFSQTSFGCVSQNFRCSPASLVPIKRGAAVSPPMPRAPDGRLRERTLPVTQRGVFTLVGAASLVLSACAAEHQHARPSEPAAAVMPRMFVDPAPNYVAHIRELLGKEAF